VVGDVSVDPADDQGAAAFAPRASSFGRKTV